MSRYAVVLVVAAVLMGCGRKKEPAAARPAEPPPVRAAVVRVEPAPFASSVSITGTLVSNATVTVKAETIGKVLRFPKEEGDPVGVGEPVVWVDDSNQKIALRQGETAVQVAEAALERARIMEDHNRAEYERAQNLLKSGGITDKDYKAAMLAGRDSRAQVSLGEAQLEQARSQVEHARKMLKDSIVLAPVTGEIQAKLVNPGAYVEAPTALFTIVDNSRLELEAMVATADLAAIQPGQSVTFSVNAWPGRAFEGSVIEINPAVQAETRSAKVRVRVPNPGRALRAGMFAQGEIRTGAATQALVIPAAAVYRDERGARDAYVFIVVEGRAVRRAVRVGRERGDGLEIVEGLKPGDQVVTEQSIELADGVRVTAQLAAAESRAD